MKKALILLLLLPLLTGCWDRLQLRKLNLVDIAGFDFNDENREIDLYYIVTKLKSSGQGSGEAASQVTKLKGTNLVETIGQGQYTDQAPFLGITTGLYMLSERFASHDPVSALDFLIHTPYSSINIPVVVLEGDMDKFLETVPKTNNEFTENLYDFILGLDKNHIIPIVSMMNLILSREEPLQDIALPVFKQSQIGVEFSGAQLFRQGTNTGTKLNKEQVQMVMLMLGKGAGRQRYTGSLTKEQPSSDNETKISYGFSVKKENSKFTFTPKQNKLHKANLRVRLEINVFDLGKAFHKNKPGYVNRMEKELSKHLEDLALETILTLQKANCDVLGIGKEIRAHHPDIWKSLNWRKDYPRMSIEPKFEIKIINSDAE